MVLVLGYIRDGVPFVRDGVSFDGLRRTRASLGCKNRPFASADIFEKIDNKKCTLRIYTLQMAVLVTTRWSKPSWASAPSIQWASSGQATNNGSLT